MITVRRESFWGDDCSEKLESFLNRMEDYGFQIVSVSVLSYYRPDNLIAVLITLRSGKRGTLELNKQYREITESMTADSGGERDIQERYVTFEEV